MLSISARAIVTISFTIWLAGLGVDPIPFAANSAQARPSDDRQVDLAEPWIARAGSERCPETAIPSIPTSWTLQLSEENPRHTFRIRAATPFSRLHVVLVNLTGDEQIEMYLSRSCRDVDRNGDSSRESVLVEDALAVSRQHLEQNGSSMSGAPFRARIAYDISANTGDYFLTVVAPRSGSSLRLRYRLDIRLDDPTANSPSTLILASRSRLVDDFGPIATDRLYDALVRLGADTRVDGRLIADVTGETSEEVRQAYSAWDGRPFDPSRANDVTHALHDWIHEQRLKSPSIQYVILVGSDRIIPSLRVSISPLGKLPQDWQTELDYLHNSRINPQSTIGGALASELTVSDDIYGSLTPIHVDSEHVSISELYVPDVAVGRLVESPLEIIALIESFLASPDGIVVKDALFAGYDFMNDSAAASSNELRAHAPHLRSNVALLNDWTAADYLRRLFNEHHDLRFLAAHANHNYHETPDGLVVTAQLLRDSMQDAQNTLFYGLGCHAGLSVPDADGGSAEVTLDWPQVWTGKGVTVVGSTGWIYGHPAILGYQEELLTNLTQLLAAEEGLAIGDALRRAKLRYLETRGTPAMSLDPLDGKSLVGTLLYGLPMQRVTFPSQPEVGDERHAVASDLAENEPPVEPLLDDVAIRRGHAFSFPAELLVRERASDGGEFFRFGGQSAYMVEGHPIQPQLAVTLLEVPGSSPLPPRGVVVTAATYRVIEGFEPAVSSGRATTRRSAPSASSALPLEPDRWYPSQIASLSRLDIPTAANPTTFGAELGRLVIRLGQFQQDTRSERLLDSIRLDEYYSKSTDRTPAMIHAVSGWAYDELSELRVQASDASGVARVVFTYTGGNGEWRSAELKRDDDLGRWAGIVPAESGGFLQVVDAAGNVATDDHQGQYLSVAGLRPVGTALLPVTGTTSP